MVRDFFSYLSGGFLILLNLNSGTSDSSGLPGRRNSGGLSVYLPTFMVAQLVTLVTSSGFVNASDSVSKFSGSIPGR